MYRYFILRYSRKPWITRSTFLSKKFFFSNATCTKKCETPLSQRSVKVYLLAGLGSSALALWSWNFCASQQRHARQLSPAYFISTTLDSSEWASWNTKFLSTIIPSEVLANSNAPRPIWSVYVKDSDIQVERPYTPLEGISPEGKISLWVKQYPHGEVGRWLNSRLPGTDIEVRGPEQTWLWKEGTWDLVIMIAGGTGVAPFYQLLHSQFAEKRESPTKFVLLHSHRSLNDLPPELLLRNLSSWSQSFPEHFQVRTFVDRIDQSMKDENITVGQISRRDVESILKSRPAEPQKTIILVCGPKSMIDTFAGPKGRNEMQGPVRGILGDLLDENTDVYKL